MKKIALATAFAFSATTAFAGGMSDPILEKDIVMEQAASSSTGTLVPLLLLALFVAAVSSTSSAGN